MAFGITERGSRPMHQSCRIASFCFRTLLWGAAVLLLAGAITHAVAAPSRDGLQVYFIDVEGGQATLFVTPAGEALLIDTGWPGNNGRDADRIVKAVKLAGLVKLDYVL